MDLLAKMTTYVRVVESGSLAAAAKQLRISAAAVSRQIATLESELHVSLLTRSTRKLAVTDHGRRYYERCLRILREVEDAQTIGRDDELAGLLKVSAPVTFGLACVAPQMGSLMRKHPGLLVELHLEDRFVDLTAEGFHVAIRVSSELPPSPDLIGHKLLTYQRSLVAAPAYLKKHGEPKHPESLAKHDALMHFMGSTDTWTLRCGEQEARVRLRVVFRCNAMHALRELASQGAGIALLPDWFVAPAVAARELQVVLADWHTLLVTASAVHLKDQPGGRRVKAFVAHLRSTFAAYESASDVLRAPRPPRG